MAWRFNPFTGKLDNIGVEASLLVVRGDWNASTNMPLISSGTGGGNGYAYRVSVSGSTPIDGVSSWAVGDWIVFNGSTWVKLTCAPSETFTQNQSVLNANITEAYLKTVSEDLAELFRFVDTRRTIKSVLTKVISGTATLADVTTI